MHDLGCQEVYAFAAQMNAMPQPINLTKSSSKLSPDLNRLREKYGAAPKAKDLSLQQKPIADPMEALMKMNGDKVLVNFTIAGDMDAAIRVVGRRFQTRTSV